MARLGLAVVVLPAASIALVACGDDGDGGGGDIAAYCDTAGEIGSLGADVSDEEGLARLQQLRDDAPGEVRGDLDLIVDFYRSFAEAGDDTDAHIELLENTDEEELDAAVADIEAFTSDECGIDLAGN